MIVKSLTVEEMEARAILIDKANAKKKQKEAELEQRVADLEEIVQELVKKLGQNKSY